MGNTSQALVRREEENEEQRKIARFQEWSQRTPYDVRILEMMLSDRSLSEEEHNWILGRLRYEDLDDEDRQETREQALFDCNETAERLCSTFDG